MNKIDVEVIFFDLDGTLFLSTPILHKAYRQGVEEYNRMEKLDLPVPGEPEVLDQVGNPVSEIYSNLFPGVPFGKLQGLGRVILERLVGEISKKRGRLINGVRELLEDLHQNYPLAIITNAQRVYMEAVLNTYGLEKYFEKMLCIEDVESEKKASLIKNALNYFNIDPPQALMVGDRSSDLEAARTCKTEFVGCSFGHGKEEEFDGELTINHLNQLPDLLA